MNFPFPVPTPDGELPIKMESGQSIIFVGANGSGKTRLGAYIEKHLRDKAHRISAHRALSFNTDIPKISESDAKRTLKIGNAAIDSNDIIIRRLQRWANKSATHLLDDYDSLVQALFAEYINVAAEFYNQSEPSSESMAVVRKETKFYRLKNIWERLLPHRKLDITGDEIRVTPIKGGGDAYPAAEMSDGERAIFYMIGQALVAANSQMLIIDEPELHIH